MSMEREGSEELERLVAKVRACTACERLPLGPRPVLQVSATARLLVASQAPGARAHGSGLPFSDASGDQLRRWMGVSEDLFYDASRVAIVPMAFCYPGRSSGGGDLAPPRVCATLWRDALLAKLPQLQLTLLVGTHAQEHVLGSGRMTSRVRSFADGLTAMFPLPHPSWRSHGWMARNPWFEEEVLPELRRQIARALAPTDGRARP